MKNIWFKSAVFALASMSLGSCADFLDIDPLTLVFEENYWNEQNDVDQIMYGTYSRMQSDDYLRRLIVWGEMRSENIGSGFRTTGAISLSSNEGLILSESLKSTNAYTTWAPFYDVINRCNLIIEKAPQVAQKDPKYTESEVRTTIAEAKALRALNYFYLVRTFKDVPFYTEAKQDDETELKLPATDGDQIIRTLLDDLNGVYSDALLEWPAVEGEDKSYARITRAAIDALMADMYLWVKDYRNAAISAQRAIDLKTSEFEKSSLYASYFVNGYPLIPDYAASATTCGTAQSMLFGEGGCLESIFELEFERDKGNKNLVIADLYGNTGSSANDGKIPAGDGLQGLFAPSPSLSGEMGTNRSVFLKDTDSRIYGSLYFVGTSKTDPDSRHINKYVHQEISIRVMANQGGTQTTLPRTGTNYDANWIFYRVSDVMLIKAEALICMMSGAEGEPSEADQELQSEAFALIKAVEDRSYPNQTSTLALTSFPSKTSLLNLLYEERHREFMFEGKRWYDLVRRSRLDGNTTYLVNKISGKYESTSASNATSRLKNNINAIYWPYNYDELKVNENLKQNSAYPSDDNQSYERN